MIKRNAPTMGQMKRDYNLLHYPSVSRRSQEKIPIYAESGKVVGEVKNGIFSKKVKASKHFLRKPPAICFDVVSLEQAKKAGATHIEIEDTETGKVYRAPLKLIWRKGFLLNRGFGEQIGLALNYWQLKEKKERQLSLFGGE